MSKRVGFLLHPGEEQAGRDALAAAAAAGLDCWSAVDDVARAVAANAQSTDLLITIGGDGTFLLGARLAAPSQIPVLGVNRGRLGFLTSVEMAGLPAALEQFNAGACTVEHRPMLQTNLGDGEILLALNDVTVKAPGVTVVRARVSADSELLGEFDCDGIVVATATGSTAYALSAGGPPIDPRVPAVIIVPLAAHAVITRAVILPASTCISIEIVRGHAVAAVDGQHEERVSDFKSVRIDPGPALPVLQLPGSPSFLRRLREKVHFGTPLKELDHPGARP